MENTILQALTKFHRLVLDGRILAIRQESLQQMSRMLNTQQQLQRAGARSLWDVQQFQVQVEKIGADIQTSTKNLERDFLELEDRLNIKLSRTNLGFLDYTLLSEKQYEWDLVYRQALEKMRIWHGLEFCCQM